MADHSYAIKIDSIRLHKFGALKTMEVDRNKVIDILPQVHEITFYESIFSPLFRCEIAVLDYIGLFVNFPLSGEEIVIVEYSNITPNNRSTSDTYVDPKKQNIEIIMAIESVNSLNVADNNRAMAYVIKLVSIEALPNAHHRVQQAYYESSTVHMAEKVFGEYINFPLAEYFPRFKRRDLTVEDNNIVTQTIVIPNLPPFAAIDMLADLSVSEDPERYTYLFYQNLDGYRIETMQKLTQDKESRDKAKRNFYKFLSDEIFEKHSQMNNEERLVSRLQVVKRHSNLEKLAMGYFNNVNFEVNIAQKAIWSDRTLVTDNDLISISPHNLNTQDFIEYAENWKDNEDEANRVRYFLRTHKEHNKDYIISRMRERWGKDLNSKVSMAQVDLIATIPGTTLFTAGSMFYLEYPEIHGFNKMERDDLISGYFLVVDVKHVITVGGYHSTVLRLAKDSYDSTIDRDSRYETG